jgi:ABC-2 type transport system permease protein
MIGLAYRQWRLMLSSPQNLMLPILEPTLYLLIFGQIMTTIIPSVQYAGRHWDYLSFVLPGILAVAAWQRGVHAGTPIYVDKVTGELESLFGLPIPRGLILVANAVSMCFQTIVYSGTILAIAHVMGLSILITPYRVFLGLAVIIVFTVLISMTFSALCTLIVSQETFNVISNLVILPIVFTSSVFYPLAAAPFWIRVIASVNPVNAAAGLLRTIFLQDPFTLSAVLMPLVVSLAVTALVSIISMAIFARALR